MTEPAETFDDFEAVAADLARRGLTTPKQLGIMGGSNGGLLVSTVMVGITYFAGSVQIETGLLAIVPLIYLIVYAGNGFPAVSKPVRPREEENRIRETLRSLRSIAAVLFSLLLFFQFGNEWAIAGWLPLFLVHRLGANPVWAIFALAVYFLALMMGRLALRNSVGRRE